MKRIAQFHQDDNGIGSWMVTCDSCPLAPHAAALNQTVPPCMKGIETGMQGHMILDRCRFTNPKLLKREGEDLFIECRHGEEP